MPLGKPLLATGERETWDPSCRVMAQARQVPLRLHHQTAHAPASSLLPLNVMFDAAVHSELVACLSTAVLGIAAGFAFTSSSRSTDVASCQCSSFAWLSVKACIQNSSAKLHNQNVRRYLSLLNSMA